MLSSLAPCPMPQLLVRNIEAGVVRKLRRRAATEGISVEEAHRRLLRSALLGGAEDPRENFLAYLRHIPAGDHGDFPRAKDLPRPAPL